MLLIENILHEFTTIEAFVLILYGAFIIFLIMFGWDLMERYINADKRMRKDAAYMVFFIIAVALIGYGIYTIPATIEYFFIDDFIAQEMNLAWLVWLKNTLILLIIVPIGFVCLSIILRKWKFINYIALALGVLSTIYTITLMIIVMVNPDTPLQIVGVGGRTINSLYYLPALLMVLVYGLIDFIGIVYILAVKLSPQKEIRKRVMLGLIGIVVAGFGGFFEITQRSSDNPLFINEWLYVWGILIELIGFVLMRYFFLSIPSYDEFGWKSGMIELHVIIAETGISLYHHIFSRITPNELKGDITVTATIQEDETRPNTDLVAGGLVGIKGMLAEISGDKGKLENIEIGEKSLVFKQGKTILCLLLAEENLGVYHSLLDDMVTQIEENHPFLDNFNGDTRQIKIDPIMKDVFDIIE